MTRLIHLEPIGGIAGDMFVGACLDAGLVTLEELADITKKLVPDVTLEAQREARSSISGTKFTVRLADGSTEEPDQPIPPIHEHNHGHSHGHEHSHEHSHEHGHGHHHHHHHKHDHDHGHEHEHGHVHYSDLKQRIESAGLPEAVHEKMLHIFDRLALAEASIHGGDPGKIAFHEVGATDSLADIACAACCLTKLSDASLTSDPPPLGRGEVHIAHGKMLAPGPAVLKLLEDWPTLPGDAIGEQTTPTGAAILSHAFRSATRPAMILRKIGYGHGTRDPEGRPNTLRLLIGEPLENTGEKDDFERDNVVQIETNVDDLPGNLAAPGIAKLMEAGALDVYVYPYMGKKSRQGWHWIVLAHPDDAERLAFELMRVSGSIGVRMIQTDRLKLKRSFETLNWEGHEIRVKVATGPKGFERRILETDDLLRIASETGLEPWQVADRLEPKK